MVSTIHFNNGGRIGLGVRERPDCKGVWSLGPREPFKENTITPFPGATADDTDWGFVTPDCQNSLQADGSSSCSTAGANEYYQAANKALVFYTSMYWTTTHITQGAASGTYEDVRNIANNDGYASAYSCLINYANHPIGWKYDLPITLSGFYLHGTYGASTIDGQGDLLIKTWNRSTDTWTLHETVTSGAGGTVFDDADPVLHTFANNAVLVDGISLETATINNAYMAVCYFAGADVNSGKAVLGVS
tara:strand:- start:932 stop:1672 length:741 start_codon:yes stop_codon:yes gene_type:complete